MLSLCAIRLAKEEVADELGEHVSLSRAFVFYEQGKSVLKQNRMPEKRQ